MELLLWRHCEAEPGEPDLGRALTGKGEKQARRMAAWLHAHLPDSARILVSPARRSQQTAQALAELAPRKLKTVDALAPGASVEQVLQAVRWPDAKSVVVVVGHQPTLGWMASRLLAGTETDWPIKKGGVWWFSSRDRDGVEQVVLRAVLSPDLL
ncbi:MAG: phosphohistidine phosphatase SixA [Burkholderiales bacterium]|jgi:phosphohistidine phosphatase|nr:phosphohistidine phosphatase SixA [Burkholderiales bacterium]